MKSEIHVKQVFSSFSAFKAQPGQDTCDDKNIVNLNDIKRECLVEVRKNDYDTLMLISQSEHICQ